MSLKPDPKVLEAMKKEGILRKAHPKTGFLQARYCKIIDEGRRFGYSSNQEDYNTGNINGYIIFKDILAITEEEPKIFGVLVDEGKGRLYKFKAKSPQERDEWIKALKIVHEYALEWDHKWEAGIRELDPGFAVETVVEEVGEKTEFFLLQPFGLLKKAIVDGAVSTAFGIVKKGVDILGELLIDNKDKPNEEYLKAKKLDQMFNMIDPKILNSRLKMGFLLRECKEMTGLDLVDDLVNDAGMREVLSRRWCLLISSKPLSYEDVEPSDDLVLDKGQISLDLDFDTLYLYDETCDDSGPIDTIPLKEVCQIVLKKKLKASNQYKFVLDIGKKKYNILCTTFKELDEWLKAIAGSRITLTEHQYSALPTLRNIYWVLKAYYGPQGEEAVRSKAKEEYENLTRSNDVMGVYDIKALIAVQEKVATEFIAVINACLADRRREVKVIKIYEEVFHERILSSLRIYFKKNMQTITNGDLVEIIKFLSWCRSRILPFGDVFDDQRVNSGITLLCQIIARRILITNVKAIKNILKQDIIEGEAELDSRSELTNKTPQDVFKLVNETLNAVSYCNISELALALLDTCLNTLVFFQDGLKVLIAEANLDDDMLISISNGMVSFIKLTKDFSAQAESVTSLDSQALSVYFNSQTLNITFANISQKSRNKLAQKIMKPIIEEPKHKNFLGINLQAIIDEVTDKLNTLASKANENLISKLRVSILKQIVTFYVQAFISAIERKILKKENFATVITHLNNSSKVLSEGFSSLKKFDNLSELLSPIDEFADFLTRNYSLLSLAVHAMKEAYGNSIKWPIIETLIKLREGDIPKEDRDSVLSTCKDVYQTTEKSESRKKELNIFEKVSSHGDDCKDSIGSQDSFRSSSSGSMLENPNLNIRYRSSSSFKVDAKNLNVDGYLGFEENFMTDIAGIIAGVTENRYFAIRKERMYCYKDNDSENPIKIINLKDGIDCRQVELEQQKFTLKIRKENNIIREYNFKAKNEKRANAWVEAINAVMNTADKSDAFKLNETDIMMFNDTTAQLFTEIDKMPSLQYHYDPPKIQKHSEPLTVSRQITADTLRKVSLTLEDESPSMNNSVEIKPRLGFCAKLCIKMGIAKMKSYE